MQTTSSPSCFPLAKPESLALTLLTALTAVLSAALLALMLVSSAFAFGDSDAEIRERALDGKADTSLRTVQAPRSAASGAGQTRLVDMPEVLLSRSTSRPAIFCKGSTSSAAPALIASRGMPKTTQVASSCTKL